MLEFYDVTVLSWGALALLLITQIIVADVVGIRSGHKPGAPVEGGHDSLQFRTSRTVANTNEGIAAYLVAVAFCVFSGADTGYTGYLSWAYVIARYAYAACYYADLRMLRSVCFGVSLFAIVGLLAAAFLT